MNPRKTKDDKDKKQETHPPKPPARGETLDDQNEDADNTGLYDRDEDMYSQDARVPTDEVRDGSDKEDSNKKDKQKVQSDEEAGE